MREIQFIDNVFTNSENIAFDIETTGLDSVNSEITMIGFEPDDENDNTIFLINTDPFENVEEQLRKENSIQIDYVLFDSEYKLLNKGLRMISEQLNTEQQRLYAYNGKTWDGGFDIPFIRTRCIQHNIEWILHDIYYIDVYPSIKKDIYTQKQNNKKSYNDLDNAHEILSNKTIKDPFDSSKEATNSKIIPVIKHCYADIRRTKNLFNIILEYTKARQPNELRETGYL